MPVDIYRFKPLSTDWVGVEIVVTYTCKSEPKVERVRISGIKQFGLILSHEYDIDAFVDTFLQISCEELDGCHHPLRYAFKIKCLVSDVIGIGLGLGNLGTGTAGWRSTSTEEELRFETKCICCDGEAGKAVAPLHLAFKQIDSPRSATPLVVGSSALAVAFTAAVLNFDHPSLLPKFFVYGLGSGALAAALVILQRLRSFTLRRRETKRSTEAISRM